jgi:hypothetical protein
MMLMYLLMGVFHSTSWPKHLLLPLMTPKQRAGPDWPEIVSTA